MPRRRNSAATTTFSISHSVSIARAQINPQRTPCSLGLLQGAGAGSTTGSVTCSASRTTPPLTNFSYCSSDQWAAPGVCRSSARMAGTLCNAAAWMAICIERFVSAYGLSDPANSSKSNAPLGAAQRTRIQPFTAPASKKSPRRNDGGNSLPVLQDEPYRPAADAPNRGGQSRRCSETQFVQRG